MYARHANDLPTHFVVDNLICSLDADRDRRAGVTAQSADRVMQVAWVYRNTVHGDNLIATTNPRACCRGAGYRCDHHDAAANLVDFNADARVNTRSADANIAILTRVEVLGMWVEITDHAANSALKKLGIIDRFDVVALDALKNLGKQAGLLPCQLFLVRSLAITDEPTAHRKAQAQHQADDNH